MVGALFGKKIDNPKSVEIGPVTLTKLGFKKPPTLPLNVKIVAMTLSMEKYNNEPEEIKAIANIIANRSKSGRGSHWETLPQLPYGGKPLLLPASRHHT